MKKFGKILCLLLVMMMVMSPLALAQQAFPTPVTGTSGTSQLEKATDTFLSDILSVVSSAGYIIAVIMVIWVGIQYMIATPGKKAELKGKLWSMAIGVVLIVCGVTILGLVAQAGNTVVGEL